MLGTPSWRRVSVGEYYAVIPALECSHYSPLRADREIFGEVCWLLSPDQVEGCLPMKPALLLKSRTEISLC